MPANPTLPALPPEAFDDDVEIEVVHSVKPFVIVHKDLADNPNLSYRCKGVATYMLGKPSGWKFRIKDLMNHGTEGRDAIYAALRELRAHGYAEYRKAIPGVRSGRYRISDVLLVDSKDVIRAEQEALGRKAQKPVPDAKTPRPEKPDTGNQDAGFQEAVVRKNINKPTFSASPADAGSSAPEAAGDSSEAVPEDRGEAGEGFQNLEEPSEDFLSRLSSFRERALARKPKPSDWQKLNGAAVNLWNQHKRDEWVKLTTLTTRDRKLLSELYEFAGNDFGKAVSMLKDGILWAATQEEWAEGRKLAFGELLANDKVINYSQKADDYKARHGLRDGEVGSGATPGAGGAARGSTVASRGIAVGRRALLDGSIPVYLVSLRGVIATLAPLTPNGGPDLDQQFTAYLDQLAPLATPDA